MEKQLAEYRAKKTREAYHKKWTFANAFSNASKNVFGSSIGKSESNSDRLLPENISADISEEYVALYPRLRVFLKFILWCSCFGFFVQINFGSVFFIISLFYFMYVSMKSGTRKPWEPSAYSVFNDNCEAIDGTLSGEQFEKELKFGAGAVG